MPVLRTYVSRLCKSLEPDRAADESRAVIVSVIDRYLAFAVPKVGETALAAIEAIACEPIRTAPTAWWHTWRRRMCRRTSGRSRRVPIARPGDLSDFYDVDVFLGLDVGKTAHHGHGLTPAGKKILDKPLPNSEPKLRAVFDKLTAKFGTVLVIVDQPASIGALPLTVARDAGCKVAYLPGLAMRRIADLYPGEAKTDAKDAAVIADAARTMPHTLRSLELTDEITAELNVLVASTRTSRPRRPARPTGYGACSPSSTPAWNASSARAWTTRP